MLVLFVATALAADAVSAAAPTNRPQLIQNARQLAGRLVVSFKRTIPASRFGSLQRTDAQPSAARRQMTFTPQAVFHPTEISAFQFRLPPPTL